MGQYVALLLPIAWVVVAVIVSLVLYKTSQSFFEETRKSRGTVRKIRLVGSIVIAAIVFLGLAYFSPTKVVNEMANGQTRVLATDLAALTNAVNGMDRATEDLAACTQISNVCECRDRLQALRQRISDVDAANMQVHKTVY